MRPTVAYPRTCRSCCNCGIAAKIAAVLANSLRLIAAGTFNSTVRHSGTTTLGNKLAVTGDQPNDEVLTDVRTADGHGWTNFAA